MKERKKKVKERMKEKETEMERRETWIPRRNDVANIFYEKIEREKEKKLGFPVPPIRVISIYLISYIFSHLIYRLLVR